MTKMFDKVSQDFLNAIKGVLEAKKVNKHGHDRVGEEDDDLDNDGDSDNSDKYLHARRKAIGKAMKKEESDTPFAGPYSKAGDRKDKYGNTVKNVAKHLAKKAMNDLAKKNEEVEEIDEMSSKMKMKLGLYGKKKKMKEEADQIDELSTKSLEKYRNVARADAYDADEVDDEPRFRKRAKGITQANKAIRKNFVKGVNEEDQQIDEISSDMKSRYKKSAQRNLDQAQDFKSELDFEGEPKGSRVRKDVNRIIKNRKTGMKRANEEAEALDELSKDTLGSYVKKATNQAFNKGFAGGANLSRGQEHEKEGERQVNKAVKRVIGVNKAVNKMTKEDSDQIDELSQDKLMGYRAAAKKQGTDIQNKMKMGGGDWYKTDGKDTDTLKKRLVGYKMAGRKVNPGLAASVGKAPRVAATEEVQIDELSKDTMRSYMDKASDARSHRKLPTKKVDNRYSGVQKASSKLTEEEIEMIEAMMAGVASGSMDGDKHMCATKVFHKEWAEGTPIKTMHADPDADGLIEWYDVMFDHGIERVMTEDMEILQAESHMHSKKKMKEEAEELEELSTEKLLAYRKKAKAGDIPVRRGVGIDTSDEKIKKKTGVYNPNLLQRAKAKLRNEEAEELDESAKVVDHLIKRYGDNVRKSHVMSAANDFGVGYTGLSRMVRKKLGVDRLKEDTELDEARGRPKKAAAKDFTVHPITKKKLMHDNPEDMKTIGLLQKNKVLEVPKTEAGQHVINQLQKAKTSMQGGSTIHFTHGESKHVSGSHAAKLITKYQGMKPSEKEDFQKKIGHSHAELMKHV